MSKNGRQPPMRVKYVDDETIEQPMNQADVVGLYCTHCGHQFKWHVSGSGWPGPYICIAPEGCNCKKHGEELRWTGVAQAPNAGAEQTTGPGAYIG